MRHPAFALLRQLFVLRRLAARRSQSRMPPPATTRTPAISSGIPAFTPVFGSWLDAAATTAVVVVVAG